MLICDCVDTTVECPVLLDMQVILVDPLPVLAVGSMERFLYVPLGRSSAVAVSDCGW
jgi:hypothetical protein